MKLHQLIIEDAIAHAIIPNLLKKGAVIHWRALDKDLIIRSIASAPNSRGQYRISTEQNPWDDVFIPDEYLEHARLEKEGDEWRLSPDFTYRMSAQAEKDYADPGGEKYHDWESQLKLNEVFSTDDPIVLDIILQRLKHGDKVLIIWSDQFYSDMRAQVTNVRRSRMQGIFYAVEYTGLVHPNYQSMDTVWFDEEELEDSKLYKDGNCWVWDLREALEKQRKKQRTRT